MRKRKKPTSHCSILKLRPRCQIPATCIFHISAYQVNKYGYYPIHLAAKNGHTDVIREMLRHRLDMMELLNLQGQNIIHAAAKGKAISHLLKVAELSQLINARDENGNTPLHLATIYGHSEAVNILANDQCINLKLVNHKGCTALDIADEQMEAKASFQKRLTLMALRVVGTPRSPHPRMFRKKKELPAAQKDGISTNESHNAKVNIILLVATLVATVTFSAGFTVHGGNNNSSGGEAGLATMISKGYFHAFVICDAVALYSSIIMAVTLILAQFGDSSPVRIALKFAFPLLGVALLMMSVAFMAGLYLVISELHWLAQFVSTLGVIIVTTLLALFALVCLPSPNFLISRLIIYYPLCLLLFAL
ncbi:unnamed protein product [Rhodiola kirilowii]